MSEQWFIDLDGIRSGPYQTSEVMSLVAEGEILPHHQIAMDLKSQKWMTILEWRLNQNKSITPKPVIEKVKVEEIKAEEIQEIEKFKEEIAPVIPTPIVVAPEPTIPAPPSKPLSTPTTSNNSNKPKRDPMAEMFDMLQNTKQKREVKSQNAHAHAHAQIHQNSQSANSESSNSGNSINWVKTVLVAAGITIIGFALGQFFQHQKAPDNSTVIATPKPATTVAETMSPEKNPTEKVGTIDRSTEKMTIRAQVPVSSMPAVKPQEHTKDLQELKDLKKELLELKALKDEIRNNNDTGRLENGPNSINSNDPDQVGPASRSDESGNPDDASGSDVHY